MELTNLLSVAEKFSDEKVCRDYLIQARWNGKVKCAHCGYDEKIYWINEGKLFKCAKCKKQFTVKLGTMFEDSAIPLRKWFFAIFILSSHKKGISSLQLSRDIKVTQKTAWFMLQRIRYVLETKTENNKLKGFVEVDEAFFGWKSKEHYLRNSGGFKGKNVLLGMMERGGRIKTVMVEDIKSQSLCEQVRKHVDNDSMIVTDANHAYKDLDKDYPLRFVINHQEAHAKGEIHIQTLESFWGMLKRGIYGIYHSVSTKHLDKYCNEFSFRYNTRKRNDSDRFLGLLNRCNSKIQYKTLIGENAK